MPRPAGRDPILELEPVIRRVVSTRVSDADEIEDLVQETLTRLYEAKPRLALRTLGSYAVVAARNLVISLERSRSVAERRAPELYDPRSPVDPQEQALRREEHQALMTALGRLRRDERAALVERDVLELSTASIARARSTTPGATATRIARSRARLRVEFLLAFRGLRPPTDRCRPVLYVLAAGDTGRQEDVRAGEHIEGCPMCPSLVQPLTRRRRGLAAIAPFGFAAEAGRWIRGKFRTNPVASSAVATASVAGIVGLALLFQPSPAPSASVLRIGGEEALPLPQEFSWKRHAGDPVIATRAPVQSVPSDEGFWVGKSASDRVFALIETTEESPVTVKPSDKVWFRGRLTRNDPQQLETLRLTKAEGAPLLRRQGYHIAIDASELRTSPK